MVAAVLPEQPLEARPWVMRKGGSMGLEQERILSRCAIVAVEVAEGEDRRVLVWPRRRHPEVLVWRIGSLPDAHVAEHLREDTRIGNRGIDLRDLGESPQFPEIIVFRYSRLRHLNS